MGNTAGHSCAWLPAALKSAIAIWFQWPGYLNMPSGAGTPEFCRRHDIPLIVHYTSGHASIADLQRLAGALKPGRVVPMGAASRPQLIPAQAPESAAQIESRGGQHGHLRVLGRRDGESLGSPTTGAVKR